MNKIDEVKAAGQGCILKPSTSEIMTALVACAVETPQETHPCEDCYLYPLSRNGRMSTGRTCFEHLVLDVADLIADKDNSIDTLHTTVAIAQREAAQAQKERDAAVELAEELRDDFVDYALSGMPNLAPHCGNGRESCIDGSGWCMEQEFCKGFQPKAWRGMEVEG